MVGASVLLMYPAVLIGTTFAIGGFASSGGEALGLVLVGLIVVAGLFAFLTSCAFNGAGGGDPSS